jgi:hypothetical protein
MLRTILMTLLALAVVGGSEVRAQKFEVTPFGGYRWGGKLSDGSYSTVGPYVVSLNFANGGSYGLIVGYYVKPRYQIEVFWDRQHTTLELVNETLDSSEDLANGKVDYLQAGLLMLLFPEDYKLQPFFSFSVGATHIGPDISNVDSHWFSSVGYAIGVKYYFSERFGVRVSSRGMSSIVTNSDKYFCDLDSIDSPGCFILPKDTWMWQFDVTAGVIVAL